MTIQVVNKHTIERLMPSDVYIGRPGPYGNPFVIGPDRSRAQAIDEYRDWIAARPEIVTQLALEQPKRLVCYCAPQPCHGDVLAELLLEQEDLA